MMKKKYLISLFCLIGCLGHLSTSFSTPYQPTDDEVLLRLPSTIVKKPGKSTTPAERLTQAQAEFNQGRINSDSRATGAAQQLLLQGWGNTKDVPDEVLLLRAKIAQYRHQFGAARKDLQHLLKTNNQHTEAWLTLAFIERVQGNYTAAQQACNAVKSQQAIAATLCQASILSLQGHLKPAYQQLTKLRHIDPITKQWQQTEMAIIQNRLGNFVQAQRHFQRALLISQRDPYLLGSYADFLLTHGQAKTAFLLLQQQTQDDSLLLRALLAAQRINAPQAKHWQRVLRARFDTAILRQETVHQREAARFALHVEHNPHSALVLAKANWSVQKEPEDALLLLQAARATGQDDAAKSAHDWAKKHNWLDILAGANTCAQC